jgi:hypothetical protein
LMEAGAAFPFSYHSWSVWSKENHISHISQYVRLFTTTERQLLSWIQSTVNPLSSSHTAQSSLKAYPGHSALCQNLTTCTPGSHCCLRITNNAHLEILTHPPIQTWKLCSSFEKTPRKSPEQSEQVFDMFQTVSEIHLSDKEQGYAEVL